MQEEIDNKANIYDILDLVGVYWKKIRWYYILICALVGLVLGAFLYHKKSQEVINYKGTSTFMLSSDDVSSVPGGMGASLGIILPGSGGTGNKTILLELLKSHRMVEYTLLTSAVVDGKEDLIINHYIELAGYRNAWKGDKNWENYAYPEDYQYDSSEARDGFLREAAKNIAVHYKPKKTDEGIFEISFTHPNQDFTKAFLDNLVVTMIDYYTEKKTAKARIALGYAKKRHDELYSKLNGKQKSLARMQDKTSEFVFIEDRVPQLTVNRDIEATNKMLLEASKSLAAARMSLVQETPFLQVIDDVRLPLDTMVPDKEKYGIIGLVGGCVGSFLLLIGIIVGLDFMKKQKADYLAKTV